MIHWHCNGIKFADWSVETVRNAIYASLVTHCKVTTFPRSLDIDISLAAVDIAEDLFNKTRADRELTPVVAAECTAAVIAWCGRCVAEGKDAIPFKLVTEDKA